MAGELRWLFTKEELVNTPSRKAGIDAEKELNYRQQCANLIQDMGQKLQVYPYFSLSFPHLHMLFTSQFPVSTTILNDLLAFKCFILYI